MSTQPLAAPAPPPTALSGPGSGWREPTSTLPLRWGSYVMRYRLGVALLILAALVAFWRPFVDLWGTAPLSEFPLGVERITSRFTLLFFLLGVLLFVAGVVVMPARSARRWLALGLLLSVFVCFGFVRRFVYTLDDDFGIARIVVPLSGTLAWLVLRERSGRAYALGLPVVLVATFSLMWLRDALPDPGLGHQRWILWLPPLLAIVGVAWLVRLLEPRFGRLPS